MGTDDRSQPMELVAYGVFRQDFYAVAKQYVCDNQEDCFRQLLAEEGTGSRGQAEAGGAEFTGEELLLLSCSLLSMGNAIEQAMKLAGFDHGMHYAALKAMERCRNLNAKVCSMAGQACN